MALINEYLVKEQIINIITTAVSCHTDYYDRLQLEETDYLLKEINEELDKILVNDKT